MNEFGSQFKMKLPLKLPYLYIDSRSLVHSLLNFTYHRLVLLCPVQTEASLAWEVSLALLTLVDRVF